MLKMIGHTCNTCGKSVEELTSQETLPEIPCANAPVCEGTMIRVGGHLIGLRSQRAAIHGQDVARLLPGMRVISQAAIELPDGSALIVVGKVVSDDSARN